MVFALKGNLVEKGDFAFVLLEDGNYACVCVEFSIGLNIYSNSLRLFGGLEEDER